MLSSSAGQHANIDEPMGPLVLSVILAVGLFLILVISWTAPGVDRAYPDDAAGNYIPVGS